MTDIPDDAQSREPQSGDAEGPQGGFLQIGNISAILGALAVLIYLLGFIAIWIPTILYYPSNLNSSIYATSLVPRTVVAGQGFRIFIVPWVLVTLLLVCFISYVRLNERMNEWTIITLDNLREGRGWVMKKVLTAMSLVMRIVVYFGRLGMRNTLLFAVIAAPGLSYLLYHSTPPESVQSLPWFLFVFLALVVIICVMLWVFAELFLRRGIDFSFDVSPGEIMFGPYIADRRAFVKGTVLCFLIAFFASVPAAVLSYPPLPIVEMSGKPQTKNAQLLSQSGGFWYVLERSRGVVAVPEAEAKEVRLSRRS